MMTYSPHKSASDERGGSRRRNEALGVSLSSSPGEAVFLLAMGFPGGATGNKPACQCRRCKRRRFDPWVRKIPWRRKWQPTPAFLPGESQGQRSPAGYSPGGHTESDTTEHACTVRRAPPSVHPAARVSVFQCRTGQGGSADTGQICALGKSRPKEIQMEFLLIHSLMSWVVFF